MQHLRESIMNTYHQTPPSALLLSHSDAATLLRVGELIQLAERAYHSLPGELRDQIARSGNGQDTLPDHIHRSKKTCDALAQRLLAGEIPALTS